MTIVGIGVDLVKVARMQSLIERWHDRALRRLFTPAELQECLSRHPPYASLAGRFAAKEALVKALGVGWAQGIRWLDIEVLTDPAGKPVATVSGEVQALTRKSGVTHIHVSVSHDGEYAIAEALLASDPGAAHW